MPTTGFRFGQEALFGQSLLTSVARYSDFGCMRTTSLVSSRALQQASFARKVSRKDAKRKALPRFLEDSLRLSAFAGEDLLRKGYFRAKDAACCLYVTLEEGLRSMTLLVQARFVLLPGNHPKQFRLPLMYGIGP